MTPYQQFAGKKLDITYETGYRFIVEYASEEQLKWTSIGVSDGGPTEETDSYHAYQLGEGRYFVNWVEAGGMTVSQVLDIEAGTVQAFLTWPDEPAHGGRGTLLQQGTVTVMPSDQ